MKQLLLKNFQYFFSFFLRSILGQFPSIFLDSLLWRITIEHDEGLDISFFVDISKVKGIAVMTFNELQENSLHSMDVSNV